MKILIGGVTGESMPPPYGGIPKVSLLYARLWKKQGHDVALIFSYQPQQADDLGSGARYFFEYQSRPSRIDKIRFLLLYAFLHPILFTSLVLENSRIGCRIAPDVFLSAAYGVFFDQLLKRYHPDVVLLETVLTKSFMAAIVANRRKIPVVFDTYAEIPDRGMGVNVYLSEMQRKYYWTHFLDLSELIIGISNCAIGALAFQPREKVKVFYDTCDLSTCRQAIDGTRDEWRESFKIPTSAFVVGAVGAFEYRKGHHHLIQSVGILARRGLNVHIAICGGSGDPKKWLSLAREYGIEERLHVFSRLSELDLSKFYRCLDVYTNLSNSSRSCGLDLALLEGMATGLPVIVYDNGGLPDAVPEKKNGWIVPTDDIQAVACAIEEARLLSENDRNIMGRYSAVIAAKSDIEETSVIKAGWLKEVVDRYKV